MRIIPSRTCDPGTSHRAEADVRFRANTQKHKLLLAYTQGPQTADEAGELAMLSRRSCYWKRCSELREMGLIEDAGYTKPGDSGSDQMVCKITRKGLNYLQELG